MRLSCLKPAVALSSLLGVAVAVDVSTTPPPSSTVPVWSAFADRLDEGALIDRIYSDGRGNYVDGVSAVSNKLFAMPGEQDWVQSGGSSSKKSLRWVWIDFRDRLDGSGPTGTLQEHPVINAHDIGSLAVGDSGTRPVRLNTSQGKVHFDGLYGSTSGGLVHRVSATQWTIDLPPGSVGALDRTVKGSTSYVASYLMPFKVTVTCMDDAACPF